MSGYRPGRGAALPNEGTCADPVAQPAWQLDDAVGVGVKEGDGEDVESFGPEVEVNVVESSGTVDNSFDDLANNGHVIAVHASADEFGTIVACGQVAGVKSEGRIVIALTPVGDSTVNGVAVLDEDTEGVLGLGDDQVKVTVYVYDLGLATPEA